MKVNVNVINKTADASAMSDFLLSSLIIIGNVFISYIQHSKVSADSKNSGSSDDGYYDDENDDSQKRQHYNIVYKIGESWCPCRCYSNFPSYYANAYGVTRFEM